MREMIFHPAVEDDVDASYVWYEGKVVGLGDDFLNELEAAYQTIIELPTTWPKFHDQFRRFVLGKFPFSIIYGCENETVYVVAVMHNSRKPGSWVKRT